MNSLVSIIVPVYNAEDYINDTIQSVLKQTYINIELIIVDDGSSDNSLNVAQLYQEKDTRVKVYSQSNSGVSVARNKGISLAEGDYILFLDSDDFIEENSIEVLLKTRQRQDELIVFGYYTHQPNGQVIIKPNNQNDIELNLQELSHSFWDYYEIGVTNSPVNKLYEANIIKDNNLFFPDDIRMGEDLIFNLTYFTKINTLRIINKTLYHYIIHENQATAKIDLNISTNMMPYLSAIEVFIMEYGKNDSLTHSGHYHSVFKHLLTAIEMAYLDNSLSTEEQMDYLQRMVRLFNKLTPMEQYVGVTHKEQWILKQIRHGCYRAVHYWFKYYNMTKRTAKRILRPKRGG